MPKIYKHSGSHLYLIFWKASRAVMRYHERSVSDQGFASLSDFAVLEVLLHMGALPVNAIGERVLLTSGSITTAVQRLEKKRPVAKGTQQARRPSSSRTINWRRPGADREQLVTTRG